MIHAPPALAGQTSQAEGGLRVMPGHSLDSEKYQHNKKDHWGALSLRMAIILEKVAIWNSVRVSHFSGFFPEFLHPF